ncbi:alanine racemase [Litoribacillus peritrichatus]|uniref:DSD1 family PLP-dependent enzyme n=1 Tax=Litoribacillus peritrichatus TaxID=718191 RepID=A0ABP7NDN5_9GAMM
MTTKPSLNPSYAPYFGQLNNELKLVGGGRPRLVLDLDALDHNLSQMKKNWPANTQFRLVIKSLPCIELLQYIAHQMGSMNFMAFHQPFLNQIVQVFPKGNLLLGKPLPLAAVSEFYQLHQSNPTAFNPDSQLQWLIDTSERLQQYLTLAQQQQRRFQINIEVNIGLQRGGVNANSTLDSLLTTIQRHPEHLKLTGLMGYDAHVGKLPGFIESRNTSYRKSQARLKGYLEYVQQNYPQLVPSEGLTINGAGSPTIEIHKQQSQCNDLSAGSCLVKPANFDLATLQDYQPACFIAAPVIKTLPGFALPGPEIISKPLQRIHQRFGQTFFIYGGDWKARLTSPKGLYENPIYGSSANQAIVNGAKSINLAPDDHIFFRPKESEAVFLQFGRILAVRKGRKEADWPVLQQP